MLRQTMLAVLLSSPLWVWANEVKTVEAVAEKISKADKTVKNAQKAKESVKTVLEQTNDTLKAVKSSQMQPENTSASKAAKDKAKPAAKTNAGTPSNQVGQTQPENTSASKAAKDKAKPAKASRIYTKRDAVVRDKQSVYHLNFASPSRNIVCGGDVLAKFGGATGVSCYLKKMDNQPLLPKPKTCQNHWGKVFELPQTGQPNLGCYTDTPYSDEPMALSYGDKVRGQGWLCTSLATGMKCVNQQGHGFEIGRSKQVFF